MSRSRSRNWIFTSFSEEQLVFESPSIKAVWWQQECCPDTGRYHFQGYIEFNEQKSIRFLQSLLPGSHFEMRRGSKQEAVAYCTKQETRVAGPWTFGDTTMRQGKRTDIEAFKESIDAGNDDLQLWSDSFSHMLKHHRAAAVYKGLVARPRDFKSFVTVLWGRTGTGKTRHVFDNNVVGSIYVFPQSTGDAYWFDGYDPLRHTVLLLDDFYGWLPLAFMLKLLDRYPMQVPVKGGFVNFRCEKIYITSNVPWDNFYNWTKLGTNHKDAFERRLDQIQHFE